MLASTAASADLLEIRRARTESLVPPSPALVRRLWNKYRSSPADAASFDVLEQVLLSALDGGDGDLATEALLAIENQFPIDKSARAKRLHALWLEGQGRLDEALDMYREILRASEGGDVEARKREVAVLLAKGKRADALDKLNAYCDAFAGDAEAWQMLTGMYLDEGMYVQAQYAAEELVLLEPNSCPAHLRIADVLYTRGDHAAALKYYCRALELVAGSARALYGIRQSARALLAAAKEQRKGDFEQRAASVALWTDLDVMAAERLTSLYSTKGGAQAEVLGEWLK